MQGGRFRKQFLDKSNSSSEDKLPKSMGILSSRKLQPLRSNSLKEHNPEIEAGSKLVGFELGNIPDNNREIQDSEACPNLHSDNVRVLRFVKRPKEDGSRLIAVLSARNSLRAIIYPKSSGSTVSFEQPDKLRVSRDFELEMLVGRFLRFLHPFKLSKTSLFRCPIDS